MEPALRRPRSAARDTASAQSDLFGLRRLLIYAMLGRAAFEWTTTRTSDDPSDRRTNSERSGGPRELPCSDALLQAIEGRSPPERPASAYRLRVHGPERPSGPACTRPGRPSPTSPSRINPNVDAIRRLYRGSAAGNAGNRGLDDAFAVDTYVPTLLDARLLPRVMDGELDLVLLSGNPGDGKTSLLVQLGDELRARRRRDRTRRSWMAAAADGAHFSLRSSTPASLMAISARTSSCIRPCDPSPSSRGRPPL